MPEWLALCDLGAPGWGEPWFPHSAVLLSLTSLVWRFCLWCFAPSCHLISRHTNPIIMRSHYLLQPCCMALCHVAMCFGVLVAVLFVFGCCLFCSLCVSCLVAFSVSFCIVTAHWTVYWSSFSTTFAAHHSTRWINYNALINGACCMPIERVDRPGESQEAIGGEKKQNTPFSDHFWKLRCRKSAHRCGAKHIPKSKCTKNLSSEHFWKFRCRKSVRRCGAKHISKSKCTKHTRFGPLLEVEMSKKCTPLWREAHFEVKMYKTHQRRTTFGS